MPKLIEDRPRAGMRAVFNRLPSRAGHASFVLHARPDDDGAMWPALAGRCPQAVPAHLRWAAILLNTPTPLPVVYTDAQVRALFRWLAGQPNTKRVSIARERLTAGGRNGEGGARGQDEGQRA